MFIALSSIVMIVGLLIYVLTTPPAHPKASVVGLVMFAAGLLAFLLQFGGWWGTFSTHLGPVVR